MKQTVLKTTMKKMKNRKNIKKNMRKTLHIKQIINGLNNLSEEVLENTNVRSKSEEYSTPQKKKDFRQENGENIALESKLRIINENLGFDAENEVQNVKQMPGSYLKVSLIKAAVTKQILESTAFRMKNGLKAKLFRQGEAADKWRTPRDPSHHKFNFKWPTRAH